MGEVYRARDTRLDRTVAIKVLPLALSQDPEWRARFEREARAIAAVTHPHICTLHDVGQHEGVHFLVMELLDGQTLAARLESGRLEMADVLKYAMEIASALDHAHQHGIIHRDLKPANVILTKSGAKLLDFGLAKLGPEPSPLVEGLTSTTPLTGHGQILGTLQYMAPEQLEGKAADARADIFAFGSIVYEMVAGRRAFAGSSHATIIGAILHTEPPPLAAAAAVAPPALTRLVAICLAKRPEDRWSTVHDVLLQLKAIAEAPELTAPAVAARGGRRERIALGMAAIATLIALALAVLVLTDRIPRREAAAGLDVLSVLPPEHTTLTNGQAPQISPDGRLLAFVATDRAGERLLYVRSRDSAVARSLPGTNDAALPFWSPDGKRLGFFAQGQLKTVAIAGGSPQTIARAPVPRGGAWNADNIVIFAAVPNQPPYRVPAAGGEATPLPVEGAIRGFRGFPSFLPDGRHYVYSWLNATGHASGIGVASIDSTETQTLVETNGTGVYAHPGYLLYRRQGVLVAQPFDAQTRQVSGVPVPIAENVGFNAITYQSLFSASAHGEIAFRDATPGSELVWFDRQGKRLETAVAAGEFNTVCLMSDGKQVVYEAIDPATSSVDIWVLSKAGDPPSRLTFDAAVDFYPVCSPGGGEVIFSTLREGSPNLFRLSLDAPGNDRPVLRSPLPKIATDWSRDGRLVYSVLGPKTDWDVMIAPLSGGEPIVFVATPFEERNGRLSPDGKWMAYVSNESGGFAVYVQPVPPTGVKWVVSPGGGHGPQWRADGRELFYVAPDRKLMSVEVTGGASQFAHGAARPLMETRMTGWEPTSFGVEYAVSADGSRFLISTATEAARPITLMRNWTAALKR